MGMIGRGVTNSMSIRIIRKTAEAVNKAGLYLSKARLPFVVPRTNAVAEMIKAPSPR